MKKISPTIIYSLIFLLLITTILIQKKSSYNLRTNQTIKNNSTQSVPSTAIHSKVIYLTMDMDMSEWMSQHYQDERMVKWYDPGLFNYLLANKVPATFFVSGLFAKTYPQIIETLNMTGDYSFENHSYDESSFTEDCYNLPSLNNDAEKIKQIFETQQILTNLTNHAPTEFRFPGDCHDLQNDLLIKSIGLTLNNGTIIAGDPFNTNVSAITDTILGQATNGGIILMHVGGRNAPESLTVLKKIVPTLEKEGYTFEKIN